MKHKLIYIMLSGMALHAALQIAVADVANPALSPVDRATFEQIGALLVDPSAHERPGAALALANLASGYRQVPNEVMALLTQTARDPDPAIAGVAARALAATVAQSEDSANLRSSQGQNENELAQIAAILADPKHNERAGAARQLVNLSRSYAELPGEVRVLLEQARKDDDPSVSAPVVAFLSWLEGPASQRTPVQSGSREVLAQFHDALNTLQDPSAGKERLDALALLRDMPLPQTASEARMEALQQLLQDDDPALRDCAGHAILALATGQADAFSQVYVGEAMRAAVVDGSDVQPPSALVEPGAESKAPGYMTVAGVFIGTSPHVVDGEFQPVSPDQEGGQAEGHVDQNGVFIGTQTWARLGRAEQQPE